MTWNRLGSAPRSAAVLVTIALLAGATGARAGSCVRLDTARDTLSPEEQKAAVVLFEDALAREGRTLDPANCTEEWTLCHVRLGRSITVVVVSPNGRRADRVADLEELPAQYSQSIRALLSGHDPRDEASGIVDRTNVTSASAIGRRAPTENLFFLRIGYGAASGPGNGSGPMLGIGWRRELNRFALDIAFANALIQPDSGGGGWDLFDNSPFTPIALGVNYHFNPTASNTPYLGAGLGYTVWSGFGDSEGMALDARLCLGYEMFRASTVRLFIQTEGSVSLNRVTRRNWDAEPRTFRPAVVTLSLGVGFGGGADED